MKSKNYIYQVTSLLILSVMSFMGITSCSVSDNSIIDNDSQSAVTNITADVYGGFYEIDLTEFGDTRNWTATYDADWLTVVDSKHEKNASLKVFVEANFDGTSRSAKIIVQNGGKCKEVAVTQEYPVMNDVLYPYFARGAADAVPGTTCAFRVVGNWYDASRGAEIADAMAQAGIDVAMPICGGAAQGVLASARESGMKLAFIDENSFAKAPGTVISSCSTEQRKAARETTLAFLEGRTAWGTTRTVGLQEGYITFIQDDPLYEAAVPAEVRFQMAALVQALLDGSRTVPAL